MYREKKYIQSKWVVYILSLITADIHYIRVLKQIQNFSLFFCLSIFTVFIYVLKQYQKFFLISACLFFTFHCIFYSSIKTNLKLFSIFAYSIFYLSLTVNTYIVQMSEMSMMEYLMAIITIILLVYLNR